MNCSKCHSDIIIKYGYDKAGNQRLYCNSCHSTFMKSKKKKEYSQGYIIQVIHQYSHLHRKVKEVLDEYKISSRTLYKWTKKNEGGSCPYC